MLSLDTGTPPPNRVELASAASDIAVVALIGEQDLGQYETLKTALARATVRAPKVIVDLTECTFIDSMTLSLMLHAQAVTTKARGAFAVVIDPRPGPVSRLSALVRLDQMLSVHPSLKAAVASFESRI
jgi:anti-anti-sigma factor